MDKTELSQDVLDEHERHFRQMYFDVVNSRVKSVMAFAENNKDLPAIRTADIQITRLRQLLIAIGYLDAYQKNPDILGPYPEYVAIVAKTYSVIQDQKRKLLSETSNSDALVISLWADLHKYVTDIGYTNSAISNYVV